MGKDITRIIPINIIGSFIKPPKNWFLNSTYAEYDLVVLLNELINLTVCYFHQNQRFDISISKK